MKVSWRSELVSWLLIAGMFLLAALSWSSAPAAIPVHWGPSGQVNRYGGRVEGLLLLPAMSLGIYLLMLVLPQLDPGRANYRLFAGPYAVIRLAVLVVMAVIYGATHLYIRGYALAINTVVPLVVGGMLIIIGNYMGKIRPNWFVGLRTPWTLSSKRSWVRTHHMGGWLFIAMGLGLIVTGAIAQSWAFTALMALMLGSVAWIFVYSYLVWRSDPDRVPSIDSQPGE
jgi:uncharacterized membrane protein